MGNKDYQQVYLIQKFIKKKYNIKIVKCKTIRDENSLALSSRNFLLNKEDLIKASILPKKLKSIYYQMKKNIKNSKSVIKFIISFAKKRKKIQTISLL